MKRAKVFFSGLLMISMAGSVVAAEGHMPLRKIKEKENVFPCCCFATAESQRARGVSMDLPLLQLVSEDVLPKQHNLIKGCCKHLRETDEKRKNVLHIAVAVGNKNVIKILTKVVPARLLFASDIYGKTPFHYAVTYEDPAVLSILLDKTKGDFPEDFLENLSESEMALAMSAVN